MIKAGYFQEATKTIASIAPGHCLGASQNVPIKKLQFSHRGALYRKQSIMSDINNTKSSKLIPMFKSCCIHFVFVQPKKKDKLIPFNLKSKSNK